MPPLSFDIEVTALPDGKVQITALSASQEYIRVAASNPFTAHEVETCIEILSGYKHNVTPLEQAKTARLFGQKLFNFLIGHQPSLYAAYTARLKEAGGGGLALRLSLHSAGALAQLPWELLRDPKRDFLALSENVTVSRVSSVTEERRPVPVVSPLRVLVAVAGREAEEGWRQLEVATAALRRDGRLTLERLQYASLDQLRLRALAEDYHVFQYIGFARVDEKAGKAFLVMRSKDRGFIDPDDLNRELYPERTVRLAVLTPGRKSYQSMCAFASQLRLPVATVQFPIRQRASVLLYEQFYRALVETPWVDTALGRARRALANSLQTGEWAAPVLYNNQPNSRLFHLLSEARKAVKQP